MKPDVFKNILWKIALCSLAALSLILDFSMLFVEVDATAESLISSASIWVNGFDYIGVICLAVMISLLCCIGMYIYAIIKTLLGKKMILYPFALPFALHIGFFILNLIIETNSSFSYFGFGFGFLLVFTSILNMVSLVASIVYAFIYRDKKKEANDEEKGSHRRALILISGVLSTIVTLSLLFVPFCEYESIHGGTGYIIPMGVISTLSYIPTHMAVFFSTFAACVCSFTALMGCFRAYSDEIAKLADKVKGVLALNFSFAGTYFVAAVAYASLKNSKGGAFTVNCYPPLLILIAIAILYCICVRRINFGFVEQHTRLSRGARIEFFVYSLLISIAAIGASVSDILRIKFTNGTFSAIRINGLTILKSYNSIEAGFQLVAFLVLIILVATSALLITSLLSLISGSKLFYKVTLASAVIGTSSTFLVGLFGKYYEIVQKMNLETIKNIIISVYGSFDADMTFTVQSQSFYWFLGAIAVMCVIILRRPYSRGTMSEAVLEVAAMIPSDKPSSDNGELSPSDEQAQSASDAKDADPSPALTLIDKQLPKLKQEMNELKDSAFENPNLPSLVNFVVEYAKNSRLHLFYTTKDIAAFIAGLGASRLTILQGMSGTGKTSLPKIFTEAVLGTCEIVEVESSWRDKNELLGYYNEFSRTYTPKKFTQALYKARLCPDRLTFIVLDEMNLSRIEYYFSDFLSLMENEEDKREIKLVNVALFRKEDSKAYRYLGLENGHTLKVPKNVWFIGTANRDESTFEISDKVYDRAHTMNFNKRAKRLNVNELPQPQKYLSAGEFSKLLENAKNAVKFDIDSSHVVKEVEELLAPYNISFGNRIANQIETFVSIYCSCFSDPYSVIDEALETILLSKVVAKLETRSVDNKQALAAEFSRIGLERCSEFVLSLHED